MIPTLPLNGSGGEVWSSPGGRTLALGCFVFLALAALLGAGASPAAAAEPCPNEAIREAQGSTALPDCRAYEQVSPVDKNATDAIGNTLNAEGAPDGSGFSYYSIAPFPGAPSPGEFPTYLSTRVGATWSTQGLLPQIGAGSGLRSVELIGQTEDLHRSIVGDFPSEPPLAEGATPGQPNYYLRDSATGHYRLLNTAPNGAPTYFADATPDDRRILFETKERLLPEATQGSPNLYESDEGQLALIAADSVAGPGGPALGAQAPGGATKMFYTQHTISQDGSRVFFSSVASGRIYVHENGETTPISPGAAYWRAATPDGRYVFYTEGEKLYRFDLQTETRQELASGGIAGVVGVSDDGSYVYYVGASNELYEWHESAVTTIAPLNAFTDHLDWLGYIQNGEPNPAKRTRVTPDGTTLLFATSNRLTAYDNNGNVELYRYDATAEPSQRLSCVSCNPRVSAATGNAYLSGTTEGATAPLHTIAFATRNLSADGSRVFFQTEEALVPQDTNAKMDVYQWEAAGHGSCEESSQAFSPTSSGCLYLISTGKSASESYFGDASTSGEDVFFFTRQSLVGQDTDDNVDVYDARVGGGIAAQSPLPPPPPCAGGEECKPPASTAPSEPSAASPTAHDPENEPKEPPVRCKKGFVRKHGRCVRKAHRHKHHRRAGASGRAAR